MHPSARLAILVGNRQPIERIVSMELTPPRKLAFVVSLLAIIAGLVFFLFGEDGKDVGYWFTFAGGALLTLSVLMKGL
ncbi:MAG: hypothetical protein A2135_03155 [Actinobacteria bacterium RBG_16_67_15]|nr:MAG: hypothetical protein A2135_03155 [Actinobacteria bacterium RBG_16_67_15]